MDFEIIFKYEQNHNENDSEEQKMTSRSAIFTKPNQKHINDGRILRVHSQIKAGAGAGLSGCGSGSGSGPEREHERVQKRANIRSRARLPFINSHEREL